MVKKLSMTISWVHDPDQAAGEAIFGAVVVTEDADPPRVDAGHAGDHVDGGALAGAVGAEQAEDLSGGDGERNAAYGGKVAEGLVQSLDVEGGSGHDRADGKMGDIILNSNLKSGFRNREETMVRLDGVATGGGDRGNSAWPTAARVPKNAPRVATPGTVDVEVNCLLGMVRLEKFQEPLNGEILRLQQELFDLGADLATPLTAGQQEAHLPRIGAEHVQRLEGLIAAAAAGRVPFTSFILPGGSRAAATLHLARAVSRRAERTLIDARAAEQSRARPPSTRRP